MRRHYRAALACRTTFGRATSRAADLALGLARDLARGRICQAIAIGAALTVAAPWSTVAWACDNPDALGVSRTVEIDTTGGPGFGMDHYKAYDFLQEKEVVLTFDDGPQKYATDEVLAALAEHCTKATFFSVGKMALGYPYILRNVAAAGHTIGTHTWSHKNLRKVKNFADAKDEIERGISAVRRAVGGPVASFFRFPTLQDSKETLEYLSSRNISMWSTDIDSFDFKLQKPARLASSVIAKLEKRGKGILLMHDIHRNTAKALPLILDGLKKKGFKIVHITAAAEVETLPEFDKAIEKDVKGLPEAGAGKKVLSIVKTVEGTPPPEEAAAREEQELEPSEPASEPAEATPDAPAADPAVKPKASLDPADNDTSETSAAASVDAEEADIVAATPETTGTLPKASDAGSPVSTVSRDGQPVLSEAAKLEAAKAETAETKEDAGGLTTSLSEKARNAWRSLFEN